VLGAIVRYLLSQIWPTPPAFPAPPSFPAGGIAFQSLTVGFSLFIAGFVLTAVPQSNIRTFALGICVGVASLSQFAVIGVSTVASAGLVLLILAPLCGLVGFTAGLFVALAFRGQPSGTDDAREEEVAE
jgi:hypothetical protein